MECLNFYLTPIFASVFVYVILINHMYSSAIWQLNHRVIGKERCASSESRAHFFSVNAYFFQPQFLMAVHFRGLKSFVQAWLFVRHISKQIKTNQHFLELKVLILSRSRSAYMYQLPLPGLKIDSFGTYNYSISFYFFSGLFAAHLSGERHIT